MKFIDNTGHIFWLESFDYEPVDYDYAPNKYVFWIDNKEHSYCSLNNYYIRPIYILTDYVCEYINIKIDSTTFKLLRCDVLQNKYMNSGELEINQNDLVNEIGYDLRNELEQVTYDNVLNLAMDNDQISPIPVYVSDVEYGGVQKQVRKYMYPFYVVGISSEVGTVMTNILISTIVYSDDVKASNNETPGLVWDFCPITVGAEFSNENEILYINGLNMGVQLPREIIRAVYNASYVNEAFDDVLYNEKLKEYLLEYMGIRGEIGNYNSAEKSLKWFGWGKHIEISSLLKTDNQFMTQFIRDYFNTDSDILQSFSTFINSTMISLNIKDNVETGEYDDYNLESEFMGENQPILENLFDKTVAVKYGGLGEETNYYRPYYNFVFKEFLYKVAVLKHYYEKYFLPVHLSVLNASVHHKVYANDLKMIALAQDHISEQLIGIGILGDDLVKFPAGDSLWLSEQIHFVDDNYNEWEYEDVTTDSRDLYYINDTCISVPIEFINIDAESPDVNVHLILEKLTRKQNNFIYLNNDVNLYDMFRKSDLTDICDIIKMIDPLGYNINMRTIQCSYSVDNGKTYSKFFIGLDKMYDDMIGSFKKRIDVEYDSYRKQFYYAFDTGIKNDDTDKNGPKNIIYNYVFDDKNNEVLVNNGFIIFPSLADIQHDIFNNGTFSCNIIEPKNVRIRFKTKYDKINSIIVNNIDMTEYVNIRYSATSEIVHETNFSFNAVNDKFLNYVILPKMFNDVHNDIMTNRNGLVNTDKKIDITYWINSKFRLRLLVNNRWHAYEFSVKMPDLQIEFGKLVYKYYDDEYKLETRFNQLSELTDNTLQFNAFMHEPRLARINHINFVEDFVKYLKTTNARYISGELLKNNEFYYYFDVNYKDILNIDKSQRIYVTNHAFGEDLIIPRKYFDYDTLFYLFLDKNLVYLIYNSSMNNVYEVMATECSTLILETDTLGNTVYNDPNNYKLFEYDPINNAYKTTTSEGEVSFVISESLRSDFDTFRTKYIEKHNITNNDKYLNQIHVYDLYKLCPHYGNNILTLKNNIDLYYHGIRFTHNSFVDAKETGLSNAIHITGNTYNLLTDKKDREKYDVYDKSFASDLNSEYSSYVNTYDDLVIYSAYAGDWLAADNEDIQPSGYIYYEKIDIDGNHTREYTDKPTSIIRNYEIVQFTYGGNEELYEYKDFKNIHELENFFNVNNINIKTMSDDSMYNISYNYNDVDNIIESAYCNRYNIDDNITYIKYKVDILYEGNIINPTQYEFVNFIRQIIQSEDPVIYNNSKYNSSNIGIRIYLYIDKHIFINNIKHIIKPDSGVDIYIDESTNEYVANINEQSVIVVPFFREFDGNYDKLFNIRSLDAQPGIDWVDIRNINKVISEYEKNELDMDLIEYINVDDVKNLKKNRYNTYDDGDDIEHILSHRKILIMNIDDGIEHSIEQYKKTLKFNDDIKNRYTKITFAISCGDNIYRNNDNVVPLTVVRIGIPNNGKMTYKYYHDEFSLYAELDEKNNLFVNETKNYELDDKTLLYNNNYEYTVFFAIAKIGDDESNGEFTMDINPYVKLKYDDYDLLKYTNIEYGGSDFVEYTMNDTTYKYGDCRNNSNVLKLYNEFFKKSVDNYGNVFYVTSIDCIDKLNIDNNNITYDMYLMHNTKNWYIIYISKDTCDKSLSLYDFVAHKKEIVFNSNQNNQYKLVHNVSVRKFLLNRYVYAPSGGKNHFKRNDIIVGNVLNNRLPIDIFKTSKWEMTPVSVDLDKKVHTSKSNIDMCIFDPPIYNNEYARGYYEVRYRYSLDRLSTQQYFKYGKIRID